MLQRSLKKRYDRRDSGEGGFTLIELLIVIVILGILAAIVVFAVGGITDRGDTSACKAEVKTLEVAIEAFRAQSPSGAYPANIGDLTGGKFLRNAPKYVTTNGGGTITAVGSLPSGCTIP